MATNHIIPPNPLLFSLALVFVLPVTPQSQIISLAVGVDDFNFKSQRQSCPPPLPHDKTKPFRPLRGPKVFFTSAKTGAGVSDVFGYVARRVVMRWEWEETHASVPFVGNGSTVHLADSMTAVGGRRRFCLGAAPHETIWKTGYYHYLRCVYFASESLYYCHTTKIHQ
jgi:hypothetical protein